MTNIGATTTDMGGLLADTEHPMTDPGPLTETGVPLIDIGAPLADTSGPG